MEASALDVGTPVMGPDGLPLLPQGLALGLGHAGEGGALPPAMDSLSLLPPAVVAEGVARRFSSRHGSGGGSTDGGGGVLDANSVMRSSLLLDLAAGEHGSGTADGGDGGGGGGGMVLGSVQAPTSAAPPLLLQEMLVQTSRMLTQDRTQVCVRACV
jgi:hypothetical protein